jgi:hypothetical protein
MAVQLLPPEILLATLRLAVEIPGALDVSNLNALSDDQRSWSHVYHMAHRAANRTKKSLVLVSKSWRNLATELLYEHVALRSNTACVKFLAHLLTLQHRSGPDHPLWFTKRLDVSITGFDDRNHDLTGIDVGDIFVRPLRSLEILVCATNRDHDPPFDTHDLLDRCKMTLRHVQLEFTPRFPPTEATISTLNTIEVLSLSFTYPILDASIPFDFPCMHTLSMASFELASHLRSVAAWRMPSLRRVTIESILKLDERSLLFFETHGSTITYLNLHHSTAPNLPPILARCHMLQHLVLPYRGLFDSLVPHPTLMRISVPAECWRLAETKEVSRLVPTVENLLRTILQMKNAPLTSVRLLSWWSGVFGTRTWSRGEIQSWSKVVELYGWNGIRLEDADGALLDVQSVQMVDGVTIETVSEELEAFDL